MSWWSKIQLICFCKIYHCRMIVLNIVGCVPFLVSLITIVLSCVRKYFHGSFLGPTFFLVDISWVQNIFSWEFRGPKIFSPGPKTFSLCSKFSLVGDFVIFSCLVAWEKVAQIYTWNWVFFSKSISSIQLLMLSRNFSLY